MATIDNIKVYSGTETVQDKINNTIDSLSKELLQISKIKGTIYTNLAFYFIVIMVMFFFMFIVLKDLYTTLNNYEMMKKDSNRQSYKSKSDDTSNLYIDNNVYDDDNIINYNINHNEFILQKLKKQNKNLRTNFDELLKFKDRYNIDDTLYTSVTPNNISSVHDNYDYEHKKTKTSFWDSLFSPPKHYALMNKLGNYPDTL